MRASLIALVLAILGCGYPTGLLGGESGCGCGREEATCACPAPHRCCHHHCHRCCRERPEVSRRESRMASIPTGPVVESVAVYRAVPGVVFAPIGGVVTESSLVRAREIQPQRESACEASSGRLGNLETSVRTLDQRMALIEESIRTQNELLLKLKTKLLDE